MEILKLLASCHNTWYATGIHLNYTLFLIFYSHQYLHNAIIHKLKVEVTVITQNLVCIIDRRGIYLLEIWNFFWKIIFL